MEPPGEFPQSPVPSPVVSEVSRVNGQARIVILGLVAALLGGGAVTAVTIGMQRGTAGAPPGHGGGIFGNELNGQGHTPAKKNGLELGTAGRAPQRAGNSPRGLD